MERSDYRPNVISRNNDKLDQYKRLILFGMETEIVTGTIATNHFIYVFLLWKSGPTDFICKFVL